MNHHHTGHADDNAMTSQENRKKEIAQARRQFVETYAGRWSAMMDQWTSSDDGNGSDAHQDMVWLMHSANYLSRFGGARWAMDPVRLSNRLPEATEPDLARLAALDFVLLTHTHADHADKQLWQLLRDAPTRWVVPPHMVDVFVEVTGIRDERLVVAEPLKTLGIHGVRITPFDGMHWEWDVSPPPDAASKLPPDRGVPATGYLLEARGRRWLFPGDTRTYDATRLPDFGPVNIVFGHVWLGRESALCNEPPLLDVFCRFIADLKPREKVILAHLYETSRPPADCWVQSHATQIIDRLKDDLPEVATCAPTFWECVYP